MPEPYYQYRNTTLYHGDCQEDGKHPCEKPPAMIRHMLIASGRPDCLILDPFAGSGVTLDVACSLGYRCIGIEREERYCANITRRLTDSTERFALLECT